MTSYPQRRGGRIRRALHWSPRYLVLISLGILFLIPFYIMIKSAGMTQAEILSSKWTWFSKDPQYLKNLQVLLSDPVAPVANGLLNSMLVSTATVIGSLTFASLTGYALARIPSRWSRLVLFLVVLTLMIPSATSFLPLYVIVADLGWVNTFQGLIVPGLFSVFNVFLFRQYFLGFPREIEEAGIIDGLSHWGVFRHLVVPTSHGIFLSLGTLTFLASWNSFLWPLVVGTSSSKWTIQVVLSTFITAQIVNLPSLFMGALVAIIPILIIFAFLQRYLVDGFKRSGISGS
jgi:multiple sugar transport system permease protein